MSAEPKPELKPNLARAVIVAWHYLYADPEHGWRGDPGGRASLRRAAAPEAVLVEAAFYDLLAAMREAGVTLPEARDDLFYRRLALVFGVLAERRSKEAKGQPLAAVLGGHSKAEDRRLKTLRFQALIAALDRGPDEEALTALRRAMKLVGEEAVDLHGLVRDLMGWKDKVRIAWTFAYFGQTQRVTAPETNPTDTEEQAQ